VRLVEIPTTHSTLRVGEVQRSIRCPLSICLLSIDVVPWAETVGWTIDVLIDSDLEPNEETCHYPQSNEDGNDDRNDPFPIL